MKMQVGCDCCQVGSGTLATLADVVAPGWTRVVRSGGEFPLYNGEGFYYTTTNASGRWSPVIKYTTEVDVSTVYNALSVHMADLNFSYWGHGPLMGYRTLPANHFYRPLRVTSIGLRAGIASSLIVASRYSVFINDEDVSGLVYAGGFPGNTTSMVGASFIVRPLSVTLPEHEAYIPMKIEVDVEIDWENMANPVNNPAPTDRQFCRVEYSTMASQPYFRIGYEFARSPETVIPGSTSRLVHWSPDLVDAVSQPLNAGAVSAANGRLMQGEVAVDGYVSGYFPIGTEGFPNQWPWYYDGTLMPSIGLYTGEETTFQELLATPPEYAPDFALRSQFTEKGSLGQITVE